MTTEKITLEQYSQSAMQLKNEKLKIITDRSIEKGGGGEGIMGGKYLLIGIGGCYSSNLLAAAQSRGIEIKGLVIDVTATISEDAPKRFSKVDMVVSYQSCSDESSIDILMTIAEKGCLSVNTVKRGLSFEVRK